MLSIFIMLIIAIALCAGIGYSILTLIKTGEVSLGIQKNQVRLEVMASAIKAQLLQVDGKVLVPVKLDGGSPSTEFPVGLVPFTTNAEGAPITYCVVGTQTETLEVNGAERAYVVAGSSTAPHAQALTERAVVAYLLSPEPRSPSSPTDCAAIETESLTVPQGIVTPIFAFASSGMTFAIEEDPELGADPEKDGDIEMAAAQWSLNGSLELNLNMPEVKSVRQETIEKLIVAGSGRVLRISGSPEHPAVIKVFGQDVSGALELAFSGDVYMKDVIFEGWREAGDPGPSFDVVLVAEKPARLFLENVVVGGLKSEGGRVALSGPEFIVIPEFGASGTPVVVNGGEVAIAERLKDAALSPSIDAPAATTLIRVDGGLLLLEGKPRFNTGTGAKLVDARGNARVATTSGRVEAVVYRDSIGPETEPISQFSTQTETCGIGEGSCTASCEEGRTAVSGSCTSDDGHALAGFGIDPSGTSFTCKWSMPMAAYAPVEPAATVVCQ